MQEGSRRAVLAALFANLSIAVAKFVAYAFTGAASMLAEAVHSVADTSNQALLLLGGVAEPVEAGHPAPGVDEELDCQARLEVVGVD